MKTIRPPRARQDVQVTCDACQATMECRKEELRFEADARDGNAYVLVCPHCKHETWVDASVIDVLDRKEMGGPG